MVIQGWCRQRRNLLNHAMQILLIAEASTSQEPEV